MRLWRWIGHSGTSAVIAEQFGTAIMPLCSRMRLALISGITSGTFGSIRNAEELSMTTAPALTAIGGELPGNAAARREQRDIDAFERTLVEFLNHDFLAAEIDGLAGRARARQRLQFPDRKAALVHGGDEFGTDSTGHAGNGNHGIVLHFGLHQAIKKPRSFSGGASVQMMRSLNLRARVSRSPAGLCGFRGAFGGHHHRAELCGRTAAASTGFGPRNSRQRG